MALIKCHECGTEISSKATKCPKCGMVPKNRANIVVSVVSIVIMIWLFWSLFGGGIEKKVVSDMTEQYNIAKKGNDSIQICVQAGLVASAYLQAHNETKYQEWKEIEKNDCKKAGIHR